LQPERSEASSVWLFAFAIRKRAVGERNTPAHEFEIA